MMPDKKRKLIWHIFPIFLVITILSLVAVTVYASFFFKSFSLENTRQDLIKRALLVKREIDKIPLEKIDALCKNLGRSIDTRITVILPSGLVVGDSHSNVSEMVNHRFRPEIVTAIKGETGSAVRHSTTIGEKMTYIALPLLKENKITCVVRAAVAITAIDLEIGHIQKNIFSALVFIAVLAAGISLFVSRRITQPIEEMTSRAKAFSQGDLSPRLAVPDSKELAQLAATMNQMAASLDEKIKTVENRSMELEAVYSSMGDGVIAVDRKENILTINQAAAKIFSLPPDTLEGKHIHEVARHYDLQQFLQKALKNTEPVEEDVCIQLDNEHIFSIHSTPLNNMANQLMGTLIIFHDITRIRRLENMHKDFAANVSHELKTPLTSVKGFVETLQETMQETIKEEHAGEQQRNFLCIIEKNVNRLIALIDDLLVLSRLERKQGKEMVLQHHDVTEVITRAVDACRTAINQRKIKVFWSDQDTSLLLPEAHYEDSDTLPADTAPSLTLPPVIAPMDPLLMEQAIVNLLSNAIKYSHPGGDVHINAYSENQSVVIHITDSGPGISHVHLTKIFQRFYRVDKARSRDMGGTGLGLAIVKHIIQYHNGRVTVNSTPGKGSCFTIKIPSGKTQPF
ncbi:MAG: ATP-binding protein [Thermodesulfobacteriota bacterium]|nr:ATP-binding protein [Thermodesulfobacteriota bacterium]